MPKTVAPGKCTTRMRKQQHQPNVERDQREMPDLNPNDMVAGALTIDSVAVTCEARVLATED